MTWSKLWTLAVLNYWCLTAYPGCNERSGRRCPPSSSGPASHASLCRWDFIVWRRFKKKSPINDIRIRSSLKLISHGFVDILGELETKFTNPRLLSLNTHTQNLFCSIFKMKYFIYLVYFRSIAGCGDSNSQIFCNEI